MIFVYGPPLAVARYTLYPATDDVLAFHVSVTVCWTESPDPLAASTAEPDVDVKNEIFADDVPVVVGAKITVKEAL